MKNITVNNYVPYHTPSVLTAKELASSLSQQARYKAIRSYINRSFVYDYIKAATVKKRGVLPDVASCWDKRMGICQDLAAMAAGMFRAVGLKASLVIGHADGMYHAWVETAYGLYDPTAEIQHKSVKKYRKERVY